MTDGTIRRLRNWAVVLAGNLETFEMSPEKGDELAGLLVVAGFLFVGSGMAECCILKLLEALGL